MTGERLEAPLVREPPPASEAVEDAGPRSVRSNTAWMLASEVVHVVSASVVLFGFAYLLADDVFGGFASVQAVATMFGLAGYMGTSALVVRRSARGGDLVAEWHRGIAWVLVAGTVGLVLVCLTSRWFAPDLDLASVALIAATQTISFWLAELGVAVGVALRRAPLGLAARGALGVGRVVGLVGFLLGDDRSLFAAALWLSVSAAAGALVSVLIVNRALGSGWRLRTSAVGDLREGAPFMLVEASGGVLSAVDRPLLYRAGFRAEAGDYSVAYRIVQLAGLPFVALVRVTDVDFHARGRWGVEPTRRLAERLTPRAVGAAFVLAACTFALAGVIGDVLGPEFEAVEPMVRLLAVLPVIQATQFFAANALSGSHHVGLRNTLTIGAIVVNVACNLVLIPEYGWQGAAVSTIVAESLLAVSLWIAVQVLARRERAAQPVAAL